MDLDFTTDQDDLRDNVRAVLERECPISLVRGIVEKTETADKLWARMVELGWPSLTVPEVDGGMGYGFVELAVVVEELGRVLAPGPLFPTLTQFVPSIREAGTDEQRSRFLGAVAAGELTGTLAVAEHTGRWTPASVEAVAHSEGGAWVISGEKHFVCEVDHVDEIVVAARLADTEGDDGIVLAVVPAGDVAVEPIDPLDQSRSYATVRLDDVRVGDDRILGTPGEAGRALARAVEEATAALALETLGTCQAIFETNVEYAKERVQFDRPIGSFQAVKHRLADGLIALERARATAYFAAACLAEDDPRRSLAVSVAKSAAGDCQRYVAREGIQLLGGIGYTWEHDVHLFVKRATSGNSILGTSAEHRARIAEMIADRRVEQKGPRWTLDGR